MKPLGPASLILASSLVSLVTVSSAFAVTWDGSDSTTWSDPNNWDTGVPTAGDMSTFSGVIPGHQPNLTGLQSVLGLTFSTATGGWSLSGSGQTLTINGSGITATAQTSGTTSIGVANITLGANQTWNLGASTGNSIFNISSAINLGTGGSAKTLTITSNAANNGFGGANCTTANLSGGLSGSGALTLLGGGGSNFRNSGAINITGSNTSFTGKISIANGAVVTVDSLDTIGGTSSTGTITLGSGGGSYAGTLIFNNLSGPVSTTRQIILGPGGNNADVIQTIKNNAAGTSNTLTFSNFGYITGFTNNSATLALGGNNAGNNTISASLTNADADTKTAVTKIDAGTWVLTGTNTYTGVTSIQDGTLSVNSIGDAATAGKLGQNGTLNFGSAGTAGTLLYTGGGEDTARAITFASTTGGAIIDQSGSGSLRFTSNLAATAVGNKILTLQGSTAGTGEIAGAIGNTNSFGSLTTSFLVGATTVTLNSTTGMTVGSAISGTGIAGGTTITAINGNDVTLSRATTAASSGSYTVAGMTSATGTGITSVTKTGTGTWTLSGANTYSGKTTISGGSLALGVGGSINNTSEIALNGGNFNVSTVGGYTVDSGESLTGSGSITGNITVNGTLAIGNSPGTITFNDGLTLGGSSISNFQIESAALGLGTYDLAQGGTGSQTVNFDGILNLFFTNSERFLSNSTVKIFDFENFAGGFDQVNFSGLGVGQSATFDPTTGFVTVVPEPGAALLGSLGALALLRRRRSH